MLFYSINIIKRWEYIYRYYRVNLERKHDFFELCFQCDEWIISRVEWFEHCYYHLTNLKTLSVQCNSSVFRRILATVEQCLFCLFDRKLSLTKRFHQFFIKQSWKEHLHEHFCQQKNIYDLSLKTNGNKAVLCSDSRCALSFESVQNLQFHCQNIHCVERIKLDSIKRRRLTRQSSLKIKTRPGATVKLMHYCCLGNEKSPYEHSNDFIDSSLLGPIDLNVPIGSIGLEERVNLSPRYPVLSTESMTNQENLYQPAAPVTSSESTLLMINGTLNDSAFDSPMPSSPDLSDFTSAIDPKLLSDSDS